MHNRIPKLNNLVDNLLNRLNNPKVHAQGNEVSENFSPYELLLRIDYIRMVVSLWKHACMADGILVIQEETSVNELMSTLLSDKESIFPEGAFNRDNLFDEMLDAFHTPAPLEDVASFAKEVPQMARLFFEEACHIVASDSQFMKLESEFLDKLALMLEMDNKLKSEIINEKVAFINN